MINNGKTNEEAENFGKGQALFLTDTLGEALFISNALIKEANKRGRVLRAS